MVEDHPQLKAQRDITVIKVDAPDPDQNPEVDPTHKVSTALSLTRKTRYNRRAWLRERSI